MQREMGALAQCQGSHSFVPSEGLFNEEMWRRNFVLPEVLAGVGPLRGTVLGP